MPHLTEVFLVEDSDGDIRLVAHILAEAGLPVKLTIARDGVQALAMLADENFKPAMIILDLNLPKLSGFEVLERNPRKDIPVVIFSGSARSEDMEQTLSHGAKEYVCKPTDMVGYRNAVLAMIDLWALPKKADASTAS